VNKGREDSGRTLRNSDGCKAIKTFNVGQRKNPEACSVDSLQGFIVMKESIVPEGRGCDLELKKKSGAVESHAGRTPLLEGIPRGP